MSGFVKNACEACKDWTYFVISFIKPRRIWWEQEINICSEINILCPYSALRICTCRWIMIMNSPSSVSTDIWFNDVIHLFYQFFDISYPSPSTNSTYCHIFKAPCYRNTFLTGIGTIVIVSLQVGWVLSKLSMQPLSKYLPNASSCFEFLVDWFL